MLTRTFPYNCGKNNEAFHAFFFTSFKKNLNFQDRMHRKNRGDYGGKCKNKLHNIGKQILPFMNRFQAYLCFSSQKTLLKFTSSVNMQIIHGGQIYFHWCKRCWFKQKLGISFWRSVAFYASIVYICFQNIFLSIDIPINVVKKVFHQAWLC